MPAYQATPAGEIRRALAAGTFALKGDAAKMVDAMIASVAHSPAPRRLLLGAEAFARVRAALTNRLAALDAQRDIAMSTEMDL
jgi:hypothetical protein